MAWNEPGNKGDGNRDPWGNNKKNQGPPDLDEALNKLNKKIGGLFGGGRKGSSNSGGSAGFTGAGVGLIAALLLVVWVISGFYTIEEAERGVKKTFGQYTDSVDPGLNWKATFVQDVTPVDVETIRSLPAAGFMLTEDENVVRVEMDVQYRIVAPEKYLFNVTNADDSLSQATDSALRYVVGHTRMDDILTTGREIVRQDTWALLEEIIEPYDMGIQVIDVNFLPARPPEEVKDAFDDAIAAQEDEQRFIREAEAYARSVEPAARGQVQRVAQESEGYREQVVLRAQGDIAQFEQLLPEYELAPEVTRDRMYLETMEKVYGNSNKVLIDAKNNGNLLYLPIDKLMGQNTSSNSSASYEDPNVTPVVPSQDSSNSTRSSSTSSRDTDRFSGRN
ncbi:FtsH protease activity modulator HflK [Alginatibacterium sediminis]|uniref:Protein HflK n=1 Tax=Alginatibacterium sediminis TaxID=2164068 RepID=A0A420E7G9_9ALTE|nr:FtsH protease activity modulator HflK [Alginatibacterium sediminis]RKF14527.1 FtsH protease activity modulator HflK [Alginatibacterium sediminis]